MKDDETRKTKQNNKTAILDKLRDSNVSEEVDSNDVEGLSRNVDSPDNAAELIGGIERIMKSKKDNTLILACHQDTIFKKYKEKNRFTSAAAGFKICKATINFKIDIMKFISLHFLKNNFRLIKEVCIEHASEFQ